MHTARVHVGSLCNLTTAKNWMPSVPCAASAHDTENKAEEIGQRAAASGEGDCTMQ